MDCDRQALKRLVEGHDRPSNAAAIESHVVECASCRRELKRLDRLEGAFLAALRPAADSAATGECPTFEEIASFGSLADGPQRREVEAHFAGCADCRAVLAAVAAPASLEESAPDNEIRATGDAAMLARIAEGAVRRSSELRSNVTSIAAARAKDSRRSRRRPGQFAAIELGRSRSSTNAVVASLAAAVMLAIGLALLAGRSDDSATTNNEVARATPTAAPSHRPDAAPSPTTVAVASPRAAEPAVTRPEPGMNEPEPGIEGNEPEPVEPAPQATSAPEATPSTDMPQKPAPRTTGPSIGTTPRPAEKPTPRASASPAIAIACSVAGDAGLELRRQGATIFASIAPDQGLAIGDSIRSVRTRRHAKISHRVELDLAPSAQITLVDYTPRTIRVGVDQGLVDIEVPERERGVEIVGDDDLLVKPWSGSRLSVELRDDGLHVTIVSGQGRVENAKGHTFLRAGESVVLKKNVTPKQPVTSGHHSR